jgi:hypothetical protein
MMMKAPTSEPVRTPAAIRRREPSQMVRATSDSSVGRGDPFLGRKRLLVVVLVWLVAVQRFSAVGFGDR